MTSRTRTACAPWRHVPRMPGHAGARDGALEGRARCRATARARRGSVVSMTTDDFARILFLALDDPDEQLSGLARDVMSSARISRQRAKASSP